ncbi:MAG TPA: DUF2905 domain-containing protein [Bryobacteraceae bacterium]|nr:DUF2905 domain-containing protein [Bryobacteraceae bacterium]
MGGLGRTLIVLGIVMLAAGLLITFVGKFTPLGRLPGDIVVRKQNYTFHFPIVTSIVLSVLLTLVMWFLQRR